MKSVLLSMIAALGCLAGSAANPAVIFQTSRAPGMPLTLEVRLSEPGKVEVDWGDGTRKRYDAGIESTEIEGFAAGKIVRIYTGELTFLDCTDNDIADLDVAGATRLQQLYCGKNLLEALDLSANRELIRLGCNANRIAELSLRNNPRLTGLYLQQNRMGAAALNSIFAELPRRPRMPDRVTLRIKGNPGAAVCNTALAADKNWLTDTQGDNTGGRPIVLTTSKRPGTKVVLEMRLTEPGTVEIDWGGGKRKIAVSTQSTRVSGVLEGSEIRIYGDGIDFLKCERMGLTDIDVRSASQLRQLYCGHNALTRIDVTRNGRLMRLGCNDNALRELDLRNNGSLTGMYFQNNRFEAKALNRIFGQLPARPKRSETVNFRVTGNPGAEKCRVEVAARKNWHTDISNDK